MYSASFIVCMALLGDAGKRLGDSVLARRRSSRASPSAAWGSPRARTCARGRTSTSSRSCNSLCSCSPGPFFPITLYPRWLGAIVAFSPLYQSAALLRGLDLGQFQWIMLVRLGYLLAIAVVGLTFAARRFQRILVP